MQMIWYWWVNNGSDKKVSKIKKCIGEQGTESEFWKDEGDGVDQRVKSHQVE